MEPSAVTLQAEARSRHNLVEQLTSFVGREREIAEIQGRLGQTRLLTLIGAGGVGKTRLARRIGLAVLAEYPGGAWIIELAPLADAATIPAAMASTLGIREQSGRAILETVADGLGSRGRTLLIVDNCEHLVEGVAAIVERLLRDCPDLTILATSREPLGVEGETLLWIPSLSVPNAALDLLAGGDSVDALAQHDATRLFVERAQAVQDSLQVRAESAGAIAQICRRLDGIPLAIELAAARARVLTPQQIAARLDDRFRLLTDGSRTALPRQRTLRAAIDWSYDLLTEPERALLQRLAVFAGGCTLEAAEAICGDGADQRPDTLDLLSRLVDKSMVVVDVSGAEARYGLLETVRAYGLERLTESGEAESVRQRHAAYFLSFAERAAPELHGPEQAAWLHRLAADPDNFGAAFAWCLGDGNAPTTALGLAAALGWFWFIRGLLSETRWLEASLAATAESAAVEVLRSRATCLRHLAWIGRSWNDPPRTVALGEASLALCRGIGDRAGTAHTLAVLGMLLRDLRDFPRAYAAAEEGLAIAREINDPWLTAYALYVLASVLYFDRFFDRFTNAAARVQVVPPRSDSSGDHAARPQNMNEAVGLAPVTDGGLALRYLEESQAIFRQLGDVWGMCVVLAGGGSITDWAWRAADLDRVRTALEEALGRNWQLRSIRQVNDNLHRFGNLASNQGHLKRAIRLLEASDHLSALAGARPLENNMGRLTVASAAARARLSQSDLVAAMAEGRAMSLEQAMAYALRQDDPFQDDVPTAAEPAPEPVAPDPRDLSALTPREREVAVLVGRGYSNRRIAEALVIAEKTAEVHARNIREKLGLESRAQIAAWAAQHGLLDADG